MLNVCLPWIIGYFSKMRATTIDLNRYKLERLLLTCNYDELNECMINSIYSSDSLIRESMADIIGEKHLKSALNTLYTRLEIEENNYVTRSIVEAIGKIDGIQGIQKLLTWFEKTKIDLKRANIMVYITTWHTRSKEWILAMKKLF